MYRGAAISCSSSSIEVVVIVDGRSVGLVNKCPVKPRVLSSIITCQGKQSSSLFGQCSNSKQPNFSRLRRKEVQIFRQPSECTFVVREQIKESDSSQLQDRQDSVQLRAISIFVKYLAMKR